MSTTTKFIAHALVAAVTLGAGVMSAQEAEACSPPPQESRLDFVTEDGTVATRQPTFVFSASSVTPIDADKFTLTNGLTGETFEVETELMYDNFFDSWSKVSATTPLTEGDYTLIYETELVDNNAPPDGATPMYRRTLTFSVSSQTQHAGQFDAGVIWTRLRPRPNDPIFEDSCGGSNAENNRLELTIGNACNPNDDTLYYGIEVSSSDSNSTVRSGVYRVPDSDFAAQTDPEGLIESTFTLDSQGGKYAGCIRVTPILTSGVVGDVVELCAPTRCAEGTNFPTSSNGFVDCQNPAGVVSSVSIANPHPGSQCKLATGFDPCDGVTCGDGEQCVDGACEAIDPCDGVTCADGEQCVEGTCESTDPCDGVTCADGEQCIDGTCSANDQCATIDCQEGFSCEEGVCVEDETNACDGVTCGDGERCFDGACYAEVTPDACDDVQCGANEFCYEGTCYDPEDFDPGAGSSTNTTDDGGCTSAPAKRAPTSLLGLALLGLVGLMRRRRAA